MPFKKSQPPQGQPWENGWAPDTSRAPGTRRLWLAGALAVATVASCITAVVMIDNHSDDASTSGKGATTSPAEATGPGLIYFATPSTPGATAPAAKKSPSSAGASSPTTRKQSPTPTASGAATPSKSSSTKPGSSKPPTKWTSVRSVNYPDRYWHASGGYVRLDPVGGSESREDSTFKLVKGLANASCYSFGTADGKYLRHRDFVLRAERNDGSTLFSQDATFCPEWSPYSGAVMLRSVNYPNYALRHKNFVLRLDPYGYNTTNREDFSFRLVDGLA
ncbi:AbfB domain-containing protein [Streptomyces sp. HUAS ZL42]|uniref:AbfB domain-containing protein n=1 Tax=Streptomyces sp. HUAS ZL42 TaxID=3231715 RepID=UPI00345E86E7